MAAAIVLQRGGAHWTCRSMCLGVHSCATTLKLSQHSNLWLHRPTDLLDNTDKMNEMLLIAGGLTDNLELPWCVLFNEIYGCNSNVKV